MQKLAEFGHRQQEELLVRQKQLEQAHDHLIVNSETILAAQVKIVLAQHINLQFMQFYESDILRFSILDNGFFLSCFCRKPLNQSKQQCLLP